MDAFHSDGLLRLPTSGAIFLVVNPSLIWVREMGSNDGSEAWEAWAGGLKTWIMCRQRLGSAWASDIEASRGVGQRLGAWVGLGW